MAENGKFVKAAAANEILTQFLSQTRKDDIWVTHCFMQYYFNLAANRYNQADQYAKKLQDNSDTPSVSEFSKAVVKLMKGTLSYRKGDLWNMEKFIVGELAYHRANMKSGDMQYAEDALQEAIEAFSKLIEADKSEKKYLKKLLAEAFFRLGEYYLLIENETQSFSKIENFLSKDIDTYISNINKNFPLEFDYFLKCFDKTNKEMTPSVVCLWNAAYIAYTVSDVHREADSLQSIVNALYFQRFTESTNPEKQEKGILFLCKFNERIRNSLLKTNSNQEKNRFPIVASKSFLVEGDLYFSWLFEIDTNQKIKDRHIPYRLRDVWDKNYKPTEDSNNGLVYLKNPSVKRSILRRMFWNYLAALNQVTDRNKLYENYHFNNMLLEINRRILAISDKKLIKFINDDLKIAWDSFPNIANKKDVLESLTFSLKVHEIATESKEFFKIYQDNDSHKL